MNIMRKLLTAAALTIAAAKPVNAANLMCVGDSVTLGVRAGVTDPDTFCYKMAAHAGLTKINKGVAGAKSADGLANIGAYLSANSIGPGDTVTVMFGINDVAAAVPVATYQANIEGILAAIKATGATPLLFTPNLVESTPYINAFPAYLEAAKTAAFNKGVRVLDVYDLYIYTYFPNPGSFNGTYYTDYQHPNPAGHSLISNMCNSPYNKDIPVCLP